MLAAVALKLAASCGRKFLSKRVHVVQAIDYEKALKGLTVLCCEDEPEARQQLELIFRHRVAKVYLAEDGEMGLEMYRKYHPDLVISDIKMPKMTGLEMSRKITELNPRAQIILLTAFDYKNFFLEAIDIGVSQYVQKPIGERKLFNAINRCIDMVLAEKKLDYQMRYMQNLLDAQSNLLFVTDGERVLMANKSMLTFAGFTDVDDMIRNSDRLNERVFYEDEKLNQSTWVKTIYDNRTLKRRRIVLIAPSGNKQFYTVSVTMLTEFKGRYLVSLTNISHIRQDIDAIAIDNMETDETTPDNGVDETSGALNSETLYRDVADTQTLTKSDPILILLYLNDLSKINREYGYVTGDQVLKRIVEVVKEKLGDNYRIGRIFGGHFVLIPPTSELELIKLAAVTIQKSIAAKKLNDIPTINSSVKIVKSKELKSRESFLQSLSKALNEMQSPV